MHNIVIGLNHKTAEVEVREKCYFPNEKINEALAALNKFGSIKGAVILSTCNRVEIYASVNNIEEGFNDIVEFISGYHSLPKEKFVGHLYMKNCRQAVLHLFKVASGIDSMVVGEYQILGQVRDAYLMACSLNYTDNYLNKLFQSAINSGKRVRTETKIATGSTSVAHLAIEFIETFFDKKKKINVLIVGAGKMARLSAQNLSGNYNCHISVCNRSEEKARELALQFNATVYEYSNRYALIQDADVVIVSTSSDEYTLIAPKVKNAIQPGPNQVKLFIDLSIPRNIDPEINSIDACMVYSIDDINHQIGNNVNRRKMEIDKAETILEEISEDFFNWYYKQIVMPTMHSLKEKLVLLKEKTLCQYRAEFAGMSTDQKETIDKMLSSYSESLIKTIMTNLSLITSKEEMIRMVESLKDSFNIENSLHDLVSNKNTDK
ncbi:MAG: glutamyl-tRNA reductase [Bacteroidales bacterium]|nr:glutamyl-tRNA reductase [Bacteroidales bacterium]